MLVELTQKQIEWLAACNAEIVESYSPENEGENFGLFGTEMTPDEVEEVQNLLDDCIPGDQSENNDKVLGLALKANNIPFTWTSELAERLWDGDEQQIRIISPKNECIYVSYDRWGFVIDDEGDIPEDRLENIDQADLVTTLNAIKKWYYEC